jgi:CRISPR/Cas system-associated exonuclease Cas4 (RecB family)
MTVSRKINHLTPSANMTQPLQQSQKRLTPYAWVTRVAQLMAKEKNCHYGNWLPTNYHISLLPSDFDSSDHDKMVIQRSIELQNLGFSVNVENANSFKVKGKTYSICIAGRPDIVAIKDNWVVVEDCKSGREKTSHLYQILLYMLLLPHAPETKSLCKGQIPHGRLVYPDRIIDIPNQRIDRDFITHFQQVLSSLTRPDFPPRQPHSSECRYCRLPEKNCSFKRVSYANSRG